MGCQPTPTVGPFKIKIDFIAATDIQQYTSYKTGLEKTPEEIPEVAVSLTVWRSDLSVSLVWMRSFTF